MPNSEDRAAKLADLKNEYEQLKDTPRQFDQFERAERACKASSLNHRAYNLYQRIGGRAQEAALWRATAELLHRLIDEAYPETFDNAMEHLMKGDSTGLETIVKFLEDDPWFFRTGYIKADLVKYVRRVELSDSYRVRLQKVILNAIDLRDRREFRYYCLLAKKIQDHQFKELIETRLQSSDPGIQRRAGWVLSSMTHSELFHLHRGKKKLRLHEYRDAIGDFTRALLLAPNFVAAAFNRGRAYAGLKLFREAIDDFDRAMGMNDRSVYPTTLRRLKNTSVRAQRAWCLANLYEYEQAVLEFSEIIEFDDKYWYAHSGRGRAYYNLGKYDLAIPDLLRSISIHDNHDAHFILALAYRKQSMVDRAIEELRKAALLDNNDLYAWAELSDISFCQQNYEESFNAAEQAVKINGESALARCYRGRVLVHKGLFADAEFDLTKSISIDSELLNGEAFYWRAKALHEAGKLAEADSDLTAARNAGFALSDDDNS
jgi:tetratricopeptide (TPR) repeat protein